MCQGRSSLVPAGGDPPLLAIRMNLTDNVKGGIRAVHASGLEQGRDGAWVRGCSGGCSSTEGALGLDGMGHHPGQPRGVLNCAHLLEATYGPSTGCRHPCCSFDHLRHNSLVCTYVMAF